MSKPKRNVSLAPTAFTRHYEETLPEVSNLSLDGNWLNRTVCQQNRNAVNQWVAPSAAQTSDTDSLKLQGLTADRAD
jgi:hypothetical protein